MDEYRNAYRLFDTWDGKRMLGKPRHRRDNNIISSSSTLKKGVSRCGLVSSGS